MRRRKKPESRNIAKPGFRNLSIEVERVRVPDPFAPDRTITVERNTRTDPIEYLAARKHLDPTQKLAADRFLALWETAAFGGISSVDLAGQRVDHTPNRGVLNDSVIAAHSKLAEARREIGRSGYSIIVAVCGERHAIGDVAVGFYEGSRRAEFLVRTRLQEALTELAEFWGFVNRPQSRAASPSVWTAHGSAGLALPDVDPNGRKGK